MARWLIVIPYESLSSQLCKPNRNTMAFPIRVSYFSTLPLYVLIKTRPIVTNKKTESKTEKKRLIYELIWKQEN